METHTVILFLLSCTSVNAAVADPVALPMMTIPAHKLANASL